MLKVISIVAMLYKHTQCLSAPYLPSLYLLLLYCVGTVLITTTKSQADVFLMLSTKTLTKQKKNNVHSNVHGMT